MQNPLKAESFSSLSLISHSAVHLMNRSVRARRKYWNNDAPLLRKVFKMGRDGSRADKTDPADRDGSILAETSRTSHVAEDWHQSLDDGCDEGLERRSYKFETRVRPSQQGSKSDYSPSAACCKAISPTAHVALLQTLM